MRERDGVIGCPRSDAGRVRASHVAPGEHDDTALAKRIDRVKIPASCASRTDGGLCSFLALPVLMKTIALRVGSMRVAVLGGALAGGLYALYSDTPRLTSVQVLRFVIFFFAGWLVVTGIRAALRSISRDR